MTGQPQLLNHNLMEGIQTSNRFQPGGRAGGPRVRRIFRTRALCPLDVRRDDFKFLPWVLVVTGGNWWQLPATTSNYQHTGGVWDGMFQRCGWNSLGWFLHPRECPENTVTFPKSPREPGLGFETLWEIPRNGWDVPDRKGWDPPADQPHTHTSMGDLRAISSCPGKPIKTGKREKWRGEEKGERRNLNLHMLPISISRRKRWGDSPAFFVRNVRRAFLF